MSALSESRSLTSYLDQKGGVQKTWMREFLLLFLVLYPSIGYYFSLIEIPRIPLTLSGVLDGLMFFVCLVVVSRIYFFKQSRRVPVLFWAICFYGLSMIWAVFFSPNISLVVRTIVNQMSHPLYYLALMAVSISLNDSIRIGRALVVSSVFPILIGLLQLVSRYVPFFENIFTKFFLVVAPFGLNIQPGLGVPRLTGSFITYNQYAAYLAIIFVINLSGISSVPHKFFWKVLNIGLTALIIFLTFTRIVWITIPIVLGLIVVFRLNLMGSCKGFSRYLASREPLLEHYNNLQSLRMSYLLISGLSFLFFLVLILVVMVPSINQLIAARINPSAIRDEGMLDWRLTLIKNGVRWFLDKPLGYGLGTSRLLTASVGLGKYRDIAGGHVGMVVGPAMHNGYLRAAVEQGVFGLMSYLFVLWSLFRLGFRAVKCKSSVLVSRWGICLLGATIIITINGVLDAGLYYGGYQLWAIAAATEMVMLYAPHSPYKVTHPVKE